MKNSDADRHPEEHSFVLSNGIDPDARTIYLFGGVHEEMAFRFMVGFRMLDSTEGPIRIVLNTGGGSETDGYAIYDAIAMARNDVTTDCYGAVMSIGALILQAAKRRRMAPGCRFMMHHGHHEMGGAVDQRTFIAIARESKWMTETYLQTIATRSGQPISKVRKWCSDEKYFSAAESVACGFADEIISRETVELPLVDVSEATASLSVEVLPLLDQPADQKKTPKKPRRRGTTRSES